MPRQFDGHIGHEVENRCEFDTYACVTCNIWLEPDCPCDDGECSYKGRPDVPYPEDDLPV